jgi:hypothetical protein
MQWYGRQHKWTAYLVVKWDRETHNIPLNRSMKAVRTKPVHSTDSEDGYDCQTSLHSCVHDTKSKSWADANSVIWLNASVSDAQSIQRVVNHSKPMRTPSGTHDFLTTIKRKHSGILTRSVITLHNKICSHMTCTVLHMLRSMRCKVSHHPPCKPDYNSHVSGCLKKVPKGHTFASNEDIRDEMMQKLM